MSYSSVGGQIWHMLTRNHTALLAVHTFIHKRNKAIVDYTSPSLCTPVTPFPPIGHVAYRQRAGGGPSHGHRQHAQKFSKDRACSSRDILADRQTHRQTYSSQYFATAPAGEVMSHIPAFNPQPQSVAALWLLLISRRAAGRRLSWHGWLGKILRWFARPNTVSGCHPSRPICRGGGRELNPRPSSSRLQRPYH